jgi:integrase
VGRLLSVDLMPKRELLYVHRYRDRHQKIRRYVRRPGHKSILLRAEPGSDDYMAEYRAAILGQPTRKEWSRAGSIAELVTNYQRSAAFQNLKASSQHAYRIVLGPILQAHGHRSAAGMPPEKALKMIEEIGATRPGLANLAKAILSKIFRYAVKTRMRPDNPFSGIERYKLGTHHTWTDEEIAAFEKRWPIGTRERLAFALLLFTGQRGGDVVAMKRSDVKGGVIRVVQEKTAEDDDDEMHIPIHPELARALKAVPAKGLYLIGDRNGRPITRRHLTGFMVAAAKKAGLPRTCIPHGLRKAALRRLAEYGATTKQIAAISGHKSLKEIERYTDRADQKRLAVAGLDRLPGSRKDKGE